MPDSQLQPYPNFNILLVDDEPSYLRSLSLLLERKGGINNIITCDDSRQALAILNKHNVGIVLLDLTMPHISGVDLLKVIHEEFPDIAIIVISGLNNVDSAVACLKLGAFDYFVKTTEEQRLLEGIKRTILMQQIRFENSSLKARMLDDKLLHPEAFEAIKSRNKTMNATFHYVESMAASPLPVMILGESGTGRELFAQACHDASQRLGPMVTLNAEGLDEHTLASQLFGTINPQGLPVKGLMEQASGGTLFIDDIGHLGLPAQAVLLKLLKDGIYTPAGSGKTKRVQARFIASARPTLRDDRDAGTFRKDLFYRMCSHVIEVPALRARKDDIPVLLDHFIEQAAQAMKKAAPSYPPELPILLSNYEFPDNVSELRSLVYDAVGHHRSRVLSMDIFKAAINKDIEAPTLSGEPVTFHPDHALPSLSSMSDMLVVEAMKRANNNQSLASRMLGISQPALSKRLKKLAEQHPDLP